MSIATITPAEDGTFAAYRKPDGGTSIRPIVGYAITADGQRIPLTPATSFHLSRAQSLPAPFWTGVAADLEDAAQDAARFLGAA